MLRDFWPPSAGAVTGDCLSVGRAHWGPTEHTVLSRAQALPAGDTEQHKKAQSQTTGEAHGGGRTASGPEQWSLTREVGRIPAGVMEARG